MNCVSPKYSDTVPPARSEMEARKKVPAYEDDYSLEKPKKPTGGFL
jgi:hypothetical protein